jgi:hypothetical protein
VLNHLMVARVLLSLLCGLQGLATLAIDFNRTHATNPSWTGHARFHVVWQSISVALLSVVELMLIWLRSPYQKDGFYVALLLATVSPLAFMIAFGSRVIFRGSLSDSNGIPPVRLTLFGKAFSIDLNLAAVIAALLSLGAILAIY